MFKSLVTGRTGRLAALAGHCWLVIIVLFVMLGPPRAGAQEPASATTLEGWLTILWRDAQDGADTSVPRYFLTTDDRQQVELVIDSQADLAQSSILSLNGQHVVVVGLWATTSSAPYPALRVSSIRPTSAIDDTVDDIIGPQPWISLMCKFSDIPTEPEDLSYFQGMYSSDWPGLDHYWREQSYDVANVLGSGAVGWYVLPHPRSYYVYDQNGDGEPDLDHARAATDCTAVADADVYFPDYVGINLMFNSNLDCCAWGGSWWMNLDGEWRSWRLTWEPPWGWGNITVISHEMGHGFGLPHSSGMYGQVYDNHWDVMSDAWANCGSATHPVYGCMGQHTISPYKDQLGWIPAAERYEATIGSEATIFLERLALPETTHYKIARIPVLTAPGNFYSVETRHKDGYDAKLNGEAVIIHLVEGDYAYVLDPDGNGNTGDEGAMWRVGETFSDDANQTWVSVDAANSLGFTVTIHYGTAYDISGHVLDSAGNGIEGVTVEFGAAYPPATTDAAGLYTQTGFANGAYTVSLSRAGFTFSPVKHQVMVSDGNATHDAVGYPLVPSLAPVADGFETGLLGSPWAKETDYEGRVRVSDNYAHTGSYSLLLDDRSDPRFFSHAAAILPLNLRGLDQAELSFWWREFIDENHTDDGVFISDDDGATWVRVVSFNNGGSAFVQALVDLDAEAAAAGLALNDHFLVKFQFYDDDPIPADGYAIDDVLVTGYTSDLVPPSDLAATPLSPAHIALTWADNSADESAFRVERSPDGLGDWAEVMTVTENTTTAVDAGLACDTPYHYRVRAFRAADGGLSTYSNVASATTLSTPLTVTLAFPADGDSVCETPVFTWAAADGAALYRVQIDDDPGFTLPLTVVTTLTPAYSPTTALDPGTYYWRVQADNACSPSAWSAAWSLTVAGPLTTPLLASPPDGGTIGASALTLAWSDVPHATIYRIEIDDDPGFASPEVADTTAGTSFHPRPGLALRTYAWRVQATNACFESEWSSAWTVTLTEYEVYLPLVRRGGE